MKLNIDFARAFESKFAARNSNSFPVRVTWAKPNVETESDATLDGMLTRNELKEAAAWLQQKAWSNADNVDTWCQLMILQLRDGETSAYLETRSATLARLDGIASADDAIKLMTVSELVNHQADDAWPLIRLYTNVRMIPFVSEHRDRREVALILRYLRIKNFSAAQRNCSLFFERMEALGEESKKIDPSIPLLIEIAFHRSKLGLDETIDLSDAMVQLRKKVEQRSSELHWTDRMMAEILLEDLEQEYQRAGQIVAAEQQ